jgi:hypothetical protein
VPPSTAPVVVNCARAAIYGVLGKDGGELIPPHAVLEGERAHHRVDLILVHTPEELAVLGEHRLSEQDVAHEQVDLPLSSERERFVIWVLLREKLLQRPHNVPNLRVRATPGIHAEAGLLLQYGSGARDPGGIRHGVLNPLQTDILVRPDGSVHTVVGVDLELVAEEFAAHGVRSRVVRRVHRSELADPDRNVAFEHVGATL